MRAMTGASGTPRACKVNGHKGMSEVGEVKGVRLFSVAQCFAARQEAILLDTTASAAQEAADTAI